MLSPRGAVESWLSCWPSWRYCRIGFYYDSDYIYIFSFSLFFLWFISNMIKMKQSSDTFPNPKENGIVYVYYLLVSETSPVNNLVSVIYCYMVCCCRTEDHFNSMPCLPWGQCHDYYFQGDNNVQFSQHQESCVATAQLNPWRWNWRRMKDENWFNLVPVFIFSPSFSLYIWALTSSFKPCRNL